MNPIDGEGDRCVEVSRPKEIAVHGMCDAIGSDGALGGHQGLRKHLPTEDPTMRHPLATARKNVFAGACAGVCQIER